MSPERNLSRVSLGKKSILARAGFVWLFDEGVWANKDLRKICSLEWVIDADEDGVMRAATEPPLVSDWQLYFEHVDESARGLAKIVAEKLP